MYSLSKLQQYQALQSLPLLSDQRPSELMDKMLILLPEDEKPGFFFRRLFMDLLSADIRAHLLSESISDPRGMAQRADELWTIRGCSVSVQALSDHLVEDVYALPQRDSSSRSGVGSSVMEDGRRSCSCSVCWYHCQWGDEANQCRAPCSYSGN